MAGGKGLHKIKIITIIFAAVLVVAGCSKADQKERAIDTLLENQKHNGSIIVFTDKSLENSFVTLLNGNINRINNLFMPENIVTNVSFIDVRDDHDFNYKDIFQLGDFPQIFVFESKDIVLQTEDPNRLLEYFEEKYWKQQEAGK
ncbi:hypothetical protein [Paenibacillus sp. NEAU-GSW1]|uniref:hypothetical protein n=1 Tax=Paenibacillus sp. NEAU-GSW1 TaxID=2682486 RepID=UPI001C12BD95|nr:hypothetical protein [Paenibacillus sp. NEAU-GSW1]